MVRAKAQPRRRTDRITIVGAAAISASPLPPDSAFFDRQEDAPAPAPASARSPTSPPRHRRKAKVTFVTPPNPDGCKKRKRSDGGGGDGDGDKAIFGQATPTEFGRKRCMRKILDDDEEDADAETVRQRKSTRKRRIIFDDDPENGVKTEEDQHFNIDCKDGETRIGIPPSVQEDPHSKGAALELMRFHLPNSKIITYRGRSEDSDVCTISLGKIEAVEILLLHCNQTLDSHDALGIAPVLNACRAGMLDVALEKASCRSQVDVCICLLLDMQKQQQWTLPPIPTPRIVPAINSARLTKPHPSYTLVQALGGIFKGSIFDTVAKALSNPQHNKNDGIITARMVYSVVDNVHSKELEDRSESSSLEIPGLVPTLRPYQDAAVRWMLRREREFSCNTDGIDADASNDEWELCYYVIIESPKSSSGATVAGRFVRSQVMPLPDWRKAKSSPDERHVFCNPFSGWLASSYEDAKQMMLGIGDTVSKGGILAESMGLGKTVEVLACILANRSPLSLKGPNLTTQDHVENDESNADRGDKTTNLHNILIAHDQKGHPVRVRLVLNQTRTRKPAALHDKVCICGRSASYNGCLSWVVCEVCGEAMHGRCAGFQSEDQLLSMTKKCPIAGVRVCARGHCPPCVASAIAQNHSLPIIESRATLIVTPPAILTQWCREISCHTKDPVSGKPLKVAVYPGVMDLCRAGRSAPHEDFHLVHPKHLADSDVVLVTFQALMSDLGHSDDNPFAGFSAGDGSRLRSRKRYKVLPSPLTSVKWWRVCLDEAQRVEAPTAKSARMAHKLLTDKRWCVSGTPIGRGRLDDLYGLLLFLSLKPFDEKRWFSNSFRLSHGDALKRLSHLLHDVMWRSTKGNKYVREQMGIPEQQEKKNILQFSSVERYFYDRQYQETCAAVSIWKDAKRSDFLSRSLQKLRAACCHPQVGTSGVGGRVRRKQGSNVLTMNQILEKLVEDAKSKCEEALRIATLHTNALASLTKLKAESQDDIIPLFEKSMKLYEEAQRLADSNASPTEVAGSAILSGSIGFRSNRKTINNGAATLVWRIKESSQRENWSIIHFEGTAKTISCIRVRTCHTLPPDLEGEVAGSWLVLRPKECILQMSSTAVGGAFVDVHSFILSDEQEATAQWQEVSGFHSKKAKSWRLVIRSHHNDFPSSCSDAEHRHRFAGLDIQLFEPEIAVDNLQRLHILHNASIVLSGLIQADDGKASCSRRQKLREMEAEGQVIYDNYMMLAKSVHRQTKCQLGSIAQAREKCSKELNNLSKDSDRPWYEDALAWCALHGDEQDQAALLETVRNDLLNYYEDAGDEKTQLALEHALFRRGKFPNFNTVDGLHIALLTRIQQGEEEVGLRRDMDQEKCIKTVMNLSSAPEDGEVQENFHCRRCREDWQQKGPVCSHCHLEDDLVKFQRLSNDPEITCVLKAINKFTKNRYSRAGNSFLQSICLRSSAYFKYRDKARKEIEEAKLVWKAHFDLLSDIDELNQCKSAMRLRLEGEDCSMMTENEAAFIIDPGSIDAELVQHEVKQATAMAALRRNKDSLGYLKNQRTAVATTNEDGEEERSSLDGNTHETCTVCLSAFGSERSVLPCGHFFHHTCVDRLFKRSGGLTIRCPFRCRMMIKREEILLASNRSKEDGTKASREIKGDWGTKVNRLVGDVMDAIQMGDKGVIFSQWEEMLEIVATAFGTNQMNFIRPRSGRKFGEDVKRFRTSNVPILLMNVKSGAEGLTLTEANHVFMVEPILNCGLDMQAINRVHRIGQSSKTYVHRYIVANTVEEKIDRIRMERQENNFEDDLQEQNKHSIKGGGVDGGFDETELHQLFA